MVVVADDDLSPCKQGDIFWVDGFAAGIPLTELGGRRPAVIVQCNRLNRSGIRTVVVCPLTSNLGRARDLGNVLLEAGEAGIPKKSVVNVTQFYTLDKADLAEFVGSLSRARITEIVTGIAETFATAA